jgi:hypothetical protein
MTGRFASGVQTCLQSHYQFGDALFVVWRLDGSNQRWLARYVKLWDWQ